MKPWMGLSVAGRSASRWFARERANAATDTTDDALRRWLARNPRNERELERRELLWELLGDLQDDPEMLELTRVTAAEVRKRQGRSHAWPRARRHIAVVAAAAVTVAALGLGYRQLLSPVSRKAVPVPHEVFTTGIGEEKRIVLADGSRVVLNSNTRLSVECTDKGRLLKLTQGEALFSVRHNQNIPFYVFAGETATRDLGTVFDISYLEGRTGVSVLKGRVRVSGGSARMGRRLVELSSGQAVTYAPRQGIGRVEAADLARIASWQVQRVEFDDVSLHDAVDAFDRYSKTRVAIGESSIDTMKVSGVFHFGDVRAFTRALHGAFGIRSRRQGQIVVLLPPSSPRHSPR